VLHSSKENVERRAGGTHLVPRLLIVLLRGCGGLLKVLLKLRGSHGVVL
jgi:hypothetical protein